MLKLPLLRSASAWGSLSAISTESERRSGQSGTAVLLSDSAASEAEVPLRRIAQVLYLIEVALECLVEKLVYLTCLYLGVLDDSWMVSPVELSLEQEVETRFC